MVSDFICFRLILGGNMVWRFRKEDFGRGISAGGISIVRDGGSLLLTSMYPDMEICLAAGLVACPAPLVPTISQAAVCSFKNGLRSAASHHHQQPAT